MYSLRNQHFGTILEATKTEIELNEERLQ